MFHDQKKYNMTRPHSEDGRDTVFAISNLVLLILVVLFLSIHPFLNDPYQKKTYEFTINKENSMYSNEKLCIKSSNHMFIFDVNDTVEQKKIINHLNNKEKHKFIYSVRKNIYGGVPTMDLIVE